MKGIEVDRRSAKCGEGKGREGKGREGNLGGVGCEVK